jgi:hypothetical protein
MTGCFGLHNPRPLITKSKRTTHPAVFCGCVEMHAHFANFSKLFWVSAIYAVIFFGCPRYNHSGHTELDLF